MIGVGWWWCVRGRGQSCGFSVGVVGRRLRENKLSGSIPVELGRLTALTHLYYSPSLTRNLHVELAIRK